MSDADPERLGHADGLTDAEYHADVDANGVHEPHALTDDIAYADKLAVAHSNGHGVVVVDADGQRRCDALGNG